MNEQVRKKVLREELKKRNGGKNTVTAKYVPKYPDSAEREYIRLTNAYMSIERQILLAHIPELKRIIAEGTKGFNMDSSKDNDQSLPVWGAWIEIIFRTTKRATAKTVSSFC